MTDPAAASTTASVPVLPDAASDMAGGFGRPPASMKVMAVLVLYRCPLAESDCWASLKSQVQDLSADLNFRLLICENEAGQSAAPMLPTWAEYLPRKENAGIAWAYNAGLQRGLAIDAAWLLTLDQDTVLPVDFLRQMFARAAALDHRQDIAAIVPELVSTTGEIYSPFIAKTSYESALPAGFKGVARGDVRAFNSGALVRVTWLKRNGGYDSRFWLDFLDHALFRAIGRSGGRVWIAGDIRLEHRLSLTEDRASMSEERFQNFLEAESASLDLYGTRAEGWLYTARLMGRIVKQRRRNDPRGFTRQTWRLLARRLGMTRQHRIRLWRENLRSARPWTGESWEDGQASREATTKRSAQQ